MLLHTNAHLYHNLYYFIWYFWFRVALRLPRIIKFVLVHKYFSRRQCMWYLSMSNAFLVVPISGTEGGGAHLARAADLWFFVPQNFLNFFRSLRSQFILYQILKIWPKHVKNDLYYNPQHFFSTFPPHTLSPRCGQTLDPPLAAWHLIILVYYCSFF